MFLKKKSPQVETLKKGGLFDSKLDAEEITDVFKEELKEFSHNNSITDFEVKEHNIYTCSIDKNISIWNKKTGKLKKRLEGHKDIVTCIKIIEEKIVLSGSEDTTIRIWNLKEKNPFIINCSDKITCLDVDVMNQMIYFGTKKGRIMGIDWNNKKVIDIFKNKQNHQKQINNIYIRDNLLYSCSMDGYVKIWGLDDYSLILAKSLSQPIFQIEFLDLNFYILHYTSVSSYDSNWNSKPPFLSICDFTIYEKLFIGWNRIKSEIELWDIDTRELLYKEKIQGAIFIKKLKYDDKTGILYFALSNSISNLQLDLKKIKCLNQKSMTPSYVIYSELYNYCVSTLLFPSDIVAKTIDELHKNKQIKIENELELNISILISQILNFIKYNNSWRKPLENFNFLIQPIPNEKSIELYDKLDINFKDKIEIFYKYLKDIQEIDLTFFEEMIQMKQEENNFYDFLWKMISEKYFTITTDNTNFFKGKETPKHFKWIGNLFGYCIYKKKLPLKNVHLNRALLKMILLKPIIYEDLECVEKSNFWNTEQILKSEDVSLFRLKFPIHVNNGCDVTEQNKIEYVKMIIKNNLYHSCQAQIDQFLIGLYEIIPMNHFKIFNENEFELFLFDIHLDSIENWMKFTKYGNGYSLDSQIIQWFWEILSNLNPFQRAKLLQFTTGTTALPLNGFKGMNPEFQISKLYSKENGIIGHFDLNRIDIPEYQSKLELEKELFKIL